MPLLPITPSLPLPHLHLPPKSSIFNHPRRPTDDDDAPMDMDSDYSSDQDEYDDEEEGERDLGIGSSTKTIITTPGEAITTAKEFMRGHGTYLSSLNSEGVVADATDEGEDGEEMWVMGSVAGVVERVNKLVTVRSVKGRYVPEVGDLLLGRITDVRSGGAGGGGGQWKVDVNARLEGTLGLGSVNLPGGVQRRKLESDVLRMRELLKEGDLLVAEVQGLKQDGGMELHTRSLRYGKLRNGVLLTLSPHLIRRLKSHFIYLPPTSSSSSSKGVDVILGVNGFVWVMESTGEAEEERRNVGFQGGEGAGGGKDGAEAMYSDENDIISPASRIAISLASTLILIFAKYSIPLTDVLLQEAQRWCKETGFKGQPGQVLGEDAERRLVAEVVGVRDESMVVV